MAKAGRDSLQRAVAMHQAGDVVGAARLYDLILKDHPRDSDALRLLGIIKLQHGDLDEAEDLISKAIKYNNKSADAHYFLGRIFWQRKQRERAASCLKKCIAIDPRHENALVVLGCMAAESGSGEAAIELFVKALAVNPRSAVAWHNYALTLVGLGRIEQALDCLNRTIAIDPSHADALGDRGRALLGLKRPSDALVSFDRAISLRPRAPDLLVGRGMALHDLGRHEEALECYDQAIRTKPDDFAACLNRGITLRALLRYDEALASMDRAIALQPGNADAFRIRGATLQQLGRYAEAVASLDRAIALNPNDAEASTRRDVARKEQCQLDSGTAWSEYQMGLSCHEQGQLDAAIVHFERALAIRPSYIESMLALCMAQLPVLYMDEAEIDMHRAAYQQRLTQLCEEVDRCAAYRELAEAVGPIQPFLLAYQGQCDRSLQEVYGALVCRAMSERYAPVPLAGLAAAGTRVRIGIVSGFFRDHSNWKIPIKGWLGQLDRGEFQIFGYYTGHKVDAETARAVELCDRFVQGPMSIHQWRQTISADSPHVLIYPEVGMDRAAVQLAAQRLAPVQCNSWGHPDTSGFSTLDYYLSSELMEPPKGEEDYTERLVRLPNLSIYYEPLEIEPILVDRGAMGLRAGATVYWSGQSLFKYLPQFDQVFARIAREVDHCQFVFIEFTSGTHVTEAFKQRLVRAFAAFGLRADDYCIILPRLERHRFQAALGHSDIFLDSIGWSGCNTTLESLPFDLPIVTMAGPLMRGRHTSAILEMMGVSSTIAKTLDDYVSIAVRLGLDMQWRSAVKSQMAAMKHRVYRDRSCVVALGEFLSRVARQGPGVA
jgi:protein O-GlcNAc transferase